MPSCQTYLRILYKCGRQSLRILDIDGLHVAVQLLLRAFLIVTLSRDSYAQSEWATLDACLPHLLV